MTALAKADEGFLGGIPVTIVERDGGYLVFVQKGREGGVARDSEPTYQDNRSLHESWRTDRDACRPIHLESKASRFILTKNHRNYG